MVEITNANKQVTVTREFAGLEAYEEAKKLIVSYKESTSIDGVLVKEEVKTYSRDYDFWKASELGTAIITMIDTDLAQADPSAPREVIEE